jgi:hypothetical protein
VNVKISLPLWSSFQLFHELHMKIAVTDEAEWNIVYRPRYNNTDEKVAV